MDEVILCLFISDTSELDNVVRAHGDTSELY